MNVKLLSLIGLGLILSSTLIVTGSPQAKDTACSSDGCSGRGEQPPG